MKAGKGSLINLIFFSVIVQSDQFLFKW